MNVGKLNVESNAFLAPMAEITDYAFRTIAKNYNCGLTFTQMVSAEGIVKNNFNTLRMLTFSRAEKPIGVQLLGNDPNIIGRAVKDLVKFRPDIIDLNCGCPVDKVYGNKMGAYLLGQLDNLGKLVKKMVENSDGIPISIKIRLGPKDKVNVLDSARVIEDNGASMITVHARTRNARYDVDADWGWIRKVKENLDIPVIGNGSVFNGNDALQLMSETGCDGVLVGRGALGNPFIFKEIKEGINYTPTLEEIRKVTLEHLDLLKKEQSVRISLDRAKKNIIWYFRYQNGVKSLIDELYSASDFETLISIVNSHSIRIEENFYPQQDNEEITKKFNNRVLFWLAKEEEKV